MRIFKKFDLQKKYYPILIFLFSSIIFIISPVTPQSDSRFSMLTAYSMIHEGNTDLDEYPFIDKNLYLIEKLNSHIYTMYPIGTKLIAVPFIYVFNYNIPHFGQRIISNISFRTEIELIIASVITALTTVIIYQISRLYIGSISSTAISLIFAFSTSAWSTASRALWQHGPSMLMLSISLYLILLARKKPHLIQYTSLPLFFSFFIRPTNFISVGVLSLYVLIYYKKYLVKYIAWGMLIVIPITIWHLSLYHSILPNYYTHPCQTCKITPDSAQSLLEGFIGTLVSPNRGLFIFSPILLFSIYGAYLFIKNKSNAKNQKLAYFIIAIIFLHWIVISSFREWWAGFAFGPRYFTDVIPYFVFLLIPAIKKLENKPQLAYTAVLSFFLLASLAINYNGSFNIKTWEWNYPSSSPLEKRVWDWSDIQFLR